MLKPSFPFAVGIETIANDGNRDFNSAWNLTGTAGQRAKPYPSTLIGSQMFPTIDRPGSVILAKWVAQQHQGQLIRRTNEPYLNHLLRVAEMAAPYTPLGYEVGLCHDLIEKTNTNPYTLLQALLQTGYAENEAQQIADAVVELTDVYTKSAFPDLKKKTRKAMEEERLIIIGALAQTVKYADLYDNMLWMLKYEPENAFAYLERKRVLLHKMIAGVAVLRNRVLQVIEVSLHP